VLDVPDSLRWFVRSALGPEDPGWIHFQRRTGRGSLRFTTDAAFAQERPDLDQLTFYHPLVRAVVRHYQENPTELHPVSALRLRSGLVAPGTYGWTLFLTQITGARPVKELDFVLVTGSGGDVIDADTGDRLFWELLDRATSQPVAETISGDDTAGLLSAAEAVGVARLNARFADRSRLNEATVEARLASLRTAHERNLAIRHERLQTAEARNRAPQYLRMLQGGIRKLIDVYDLKRRELEAQRVLGRSITLEAAGIVEVTN
jgi:hypothetical protein